MERGNQDSLNMRQFYDLKSLILERHHQIAWMGNIERHHFQAFT